MPQDNIDLLADWVHGGLEPDLTVLLDAPVETGMERAGDRGDPDRFESEELEFFHRVRDVYLQLAAARPGRFVVVDATQSLESVQEAVGRIAHDLINN